MYSISISHDGGWNQMKGLPKAPTEKALAQNRRDAQAAANQRGRCLYLALDRLTGLPKFGETPAPKILDRYIDLGTVAPDSFAGEVILR